jgi:hypothetical protein
MRRLLWRVAANGGRKQSPVSNDAEPFAATWSGPARGVAFITHTKRVTLERLPDSNQSGPAANVITEGTALSVIHTFNMVFIHMDDKIAGRIQAAHKKQRLGVPTPRGCLTACNWGSHT